MHAPARSIIRYSLISVPIVLVQRVLRAAIMSASEIYRGAPRKSRFDFRRRRRRRSASRDSRSLTSTAPATFVLSALRTRIWYMYTGDATLLVLARPSDFRLSCEFWKLVGPCAFPIRRACLASVSRPSRVLIKVSFEFVNVPSTLVTTLQVFRG